MILVITLSRQDCQVSLVTDEQVIGKQMWQAGPQGGQNLLKAIQGLLQEHRTTLQDIEKVRIEKQDAWPSLARMASVTAQSLALFPK